MSGASNLHGLSFDLLSARFPSFMQFLPYPDISAPLPGLRWVRRRYLCIFRIFHRLPPGQTTERSLLLPSEVQVNLYLQILCRYKQKQFLHRGTFSRETLWQKILGRFRQNAAVPVLH